MIYTNGRRCEGNETALRDCISSIEYPKEACEEVVVRCVERTGIANVHLFVTFISNNVLGCPLGWFIYAGYCYSLSGYSSIGRDRHFGSFYYSLSYGSSRLSIGSSHEHAFVMALLAELESKGDLHSNDVWIGLGQKRDNHFRWNHKELLARCNCMQ